jgi:hypothetical protein
MHELSYIQRTTPVLLRVGAGHDYDLLSARTLRSRIPTAPASAIR